MKMKALAIIPARGGSKRIPKKNIRIFEGKAIIAYSIEVAINSGLFTAVMVSTEDNEIADIATSYGAKVPFLRSDATANDTSGTPEVLLEVIERYEEQGEQFDLGCCIYPTAPFISPATLLQGREMLIKGEFDSVFPVLRYPYPIQRALKIENNKVSMIWPENYLSRSQDLSPVYHDAGQFYWFSVAALRDKKKLWTENASAFLIPEMQAHDINNLDDWTVAEFKYRYSRNQT